jgi:hypothetical protein
MADTCSACSLAANGSFQSAKAIAIAAKRTSETKPPYSSGNVDRRTGFR